MMTGGCLCGAVRYEAEGEPAFAGHCHCRDCQRITGAGHAPFLGLPRAGVRISGATSRYGVAGASGRTTTRHFCPTCGASVFGEPEVAPDTIVFYAGTLDDPSAFTPRMAIYTRSRPAWDRIADDLPAFETTPPADAAT